MFLFYIIFTKPPIKEKVEFILKKKPENVKPAALFLVLFLVDSAACVYVPCYF